LKPKILYLVLGCLILFVVCGTKFNDAKASSIIKEAFGLTKYDTLEMLGIFMESENIALVKIKIYGYGYTAKIKKYVDRGWQLDELIIGREYTVSGENMRKWLAEYNEEMRARKEQPQMYAMKDIRMISGTVKYSPYTPDLNGPYSEDSDFYKSLCPSIVKVLPIQDPWGNNYRVYCGVACTGKYGITGCQEDDLIVISYGKDGEKELWEFNAMDPEAGIFVVNTDDDYDKDLVMLNGSWIRGVRR
jgi:hypothetical protein